LDPDSKPDPNPESDPELITVPDPNLQIITDPSGSGSGSGCTTLILLKDIRNNIFSQKTVFMSMNLQFSP
jgi:hypothetical protein